MQAGAEELPRAVRAYEVAVRGVVRLPLRVRGQEKDGERDVAKAQFIEDMKRLRLLRDRVVELRKRGCKRG